MVANEVMERTPPAPALPFETVLAALAQAIWIVGEDGRIGWANAAAARVLGHAGTADLLGRTPRELVHSMPDGPAACACAAFPDGRRQRFLKADASYLAVDVQTMPWLDAGRVIGEIVSFAEHRAPARGAASVLVEREAVELVLAAYRNRDAFLLRLDDALRKVGSAAELQLAAIALLGEQFQGARIFYSEFGGGGSDDGAAPAPRRPACLPGVQSLAGDDSMRDFPAYLEALRLHAVVPDVSAAAFLPPEERAGLAMLGVGALISIPLMLDGVLVASLRVDSAAAHAWTEDEQFRVQATAERIWEAMRRARALEALRLADRRRDEFLAMLAHELRNPLAPIRAAAELLQLGRMDERRVRHASQIIGRQVGHMTSLIDGLLDASRITRGMVELDNEALDVGQVAAEAIEQATPLMRAKGHRIDLQLAPQATPVSGDRKRLVQVLANVLDNAAKYTRDGGHIRLRTEVRGAWVAIEVADDGIGMTPELAARAFEPFTQAERTADRSQGGLGLGLATVRKLVELHGGAVACASAGPGKGSSFTITLPRLAVPAGDASSPGAGRPDAAPLRILVVDDNVDAAAMLGMLLEAGGHRVTVEHGSRRALETARREAPQVCLLDIGLPDMDGNELARRLRAQPETAHALLVAVTGYGQADDRRRTRDAGFDRHLVKPVDIAELTAILAGAAQP